MATDTGCPATIRDQWDDFLAFLGGDATKTSSLFVQLYRKVRLMEQVSDLNTRLRPDAASRRWSLGNNRVVLRGRTAPLRIPREPAGPGDRPRRGAAELESFFEETLLPYRTESLDHDLRDLDVSRWGFVTWREIDEMAQADPRRLAAADRQLRLESAPGLCKGCPKPDGVERATTLPTGIPPLGRPPPLHCRAGREELPGRGGGRPGGRYFPRSRLVPTLES